MNHLRPNKTKLEDAYTQETKISFKLYLFLPDLPSYLMVLLRSGDFKF